MSSERQWTREQDLAITSTGANLLVSAAAGTGKTSVLVERIIRLVTRPDNPVNIDEFLVVTFTDKAAQEMKTRIRQALEAQSQTEFGARAREQAEFVDKAQISTIHSFCLKLLKSYFHLVDLDPSFRVLDSHEADLLRLDALDEVFEEAYGAPEPWGALFRGLVQGYGGYGVDEGLKSIVIKLHEFGVTQPSMVDWFQMALSLQEKACVAASVWELPWAGFALDALIDDLESMVIAQKEAIGACLIPGGPEGYVDTLNKELDFYEHILGALRLARGAGPQEKDIAALEAVLCEAATYRYQRLPGARDVDGTLKELAQSRRNYAKAKLDQIKNSPFTRPSADLLEEIKQTAPYIQCLVDLVVKLDSRYREKKARAVGLDFSDLERLSVEALHKNSGRAAKELQSQYKYVLVDEYQDTNPIQEAILSKVAGGEKEAKLFMVGDIKQSIYRFRLAEPGIFLERHRTYTPLTGTFDGDVSSSGLKVDLFTNFRSRQEVVNAVNLFFEAIMRRKVAEIDYDQSHRLVAGASFPLSLGKRHVTELHLMEREHAVIQSEAEDDVAYDDEYDYALEDYEAIEKEALIVAHRIKQMVTGDDPLFVWDGKAGTQRRCTYRDIAVLMRATKDRATAVLEVLSQFGIPAHADTSTGYFQAREVELALSILDVIDNPRQDIPLAAVLRSPVVGLSAEDLALIRGRHPQGCFYDAVKDYVNMDSRVDTFMSTLEKWRTMARRKPLAEVLWAILRETGYEDFVGGLPGGAQRQANLRALCDRARQFDTFGHHGLFRFLRFVEKLQGSKGDLAAARALGEKEDAVRILSIHKAKGLEFPVVFVMDLGKKFNAEDIRSDVLFHKDLGIGALYCDPKTDGRLRYPSLIYEAIRSKIRQENLAEEMRVLYVALTRAKEKLCLVGSARKLQGYLRRWEGGQPETQAATTYLDWLCPVALREHEAETIALRIWGGTEGAEIPLPDQSQQAAEPLRILDAVSQARLISPDVNVQKEVERRLGWEYPFSDMMFARAKISVGELKRRMELGDQDDSWRHVPRPNRRMGFSHGNSHDQGLKRGIAVHTVLSKMDFSKASTVEGITEAAQHLYDKGFLETPLSFSDARLIARFFQSSLGTRLLSSHERIRRELPFTMKLPAGESDNVLVQGVIDLIVQEDSGVTVVDYKTDVVFSDDLTQAVGRYTPQVSFYALAAQNILGKAVKDVFIAFLTPGKTVKVDWERYLESRLVRLPFGCGNLF